MIIIETPAPPTRERLVLVPVGETHAHCRDATPEDLARAGYVLLVGYLPRREVETAVSDAMDLQRRLIEAEGHAAEFHDRCETLRAERNAAQDRAEKAERERDDLLEGDMREARTQRERADQAARERDEARAELARLTAVEGELTEDALRAVWDNEDTIADSRRALYRLGVAHERARQQPAQDRATDEELVATFENAYEHGALENIVGVRAVAAHVRGERCLVTRAVAANVDIRVCEDDGGGFLVGVHAPDCDEDLERNVPAADVPATLARLLGEVSRG